MALDGGFRCNDQCLGAMNHAPKKPTPVSLWFPRYAGGHCVRSPVTVGRLGLARRWHLERVRAYNGYVMFRFLVHICVGAAEVVPGE